MEALGVEVLLERRRRSCGRSTARAACASPTAIAARRRPRRHLDRHPAAGRRSPATPGSRSSAGSSSTTAWSPRTRACSPSASARSTAASCTASSRRSTSRRRSPRDAAAARDAAYAGSVPTAKLKVMGVDLVSRRRAPTARARWSSPTRRRHATASSSSTPTAARPARSCSATSRGARAAARRGRAPARAGRRPARAARRGVRRRPPPTCPTARRSATATASARARSSTRSATRGLGSTQEVVARHPRRRGLRLVQAAGRASCSRSSAAARPRSRLPVPVPAPDARGAGRASCASAGIESVSELTAACGAGRDCGACKPGLAYLVSRGLRQPPPRGAPRALHQRPRPREHPERRHVLASSRASAAASRRPTSCAGSPTSPTRHEVPLVKITGGQRIDLLGITQGAAARRSGRSSACRPATPTRRRCGRSRRASAPTSAASGWATRSASGSSSSGDGGPLHAAQGQVGGHRLPAQLRRGLRQGHRPRRRRGRLGGLRRRRGRRDRAQGRPARDRRRQRRGDPRSRSPSCSTTASTREYLERTYGYLERVGHRARSATAVLDADRQAQLLERYRIAKAAADPDPWLRAPRPGPPQAVRRARHRARRSIDAARGAAPMTRRTTWTRVGRADDVPLLEGRSVDGRRPPHRGLPHCPTASPRSTPPARTRGGPLADGIVADRCVTCPLHGRRFDLRTGEALNGAETRRGPRGRRARRRALAAARGARAEPREARTHAPARTAASAAGWSPRSTTAGWPRSRGDPLHPVNRGATCRKPLRLPDAVARARPRDRRRCGARRRTSAGAPATWRRGDRRRSPSRLRDRDEHGPDAIAFYISGQLLTEDYYAVNKLAKGFLGTNNVDSNSRLCMSSAVAGYTRRARLRRPAAVLRRHRRRPTACCCSAPTRRPATRSCGRGSAPPGRGRVR